VIVKVYLRVINIKANNKTNTNIKIETSDNINYKGNNKLNNIIKKGL